MRFTISQDQIKPINETIKNLKIIAGKKYHSKFFGILIQATDDQKIIFTAQNEHEQVNKIFSAEVHTPGTLAINFQDAQKYFKNMKGATTIETLDPKNKIIKITDATTEFSFVGENTPTLPQPNEYKNTNRILISIEDFNEATKKVSYAAADSAVRPMLAGTHLHATDEAFTFAACDSYRLAETTTPNKKVLSATTL